MKSKRIKWLDFAKGFTILFVVISHCICKPQFIRNDVLLQYLQYFSFLIIMPIFFAISGYLYNTVDSIKKYLLLIYKKSISLMGPYFMLAIICYIYNFIFVHRLPIKYIILAPKFYAVLWFLPALFIAFLITGLFDLLHIKRFMLYVFSIIILVLSKDFWMYSNNSNPTSSWTYLFYSYLLFFCIGLFIKKHHTLMHHLLTDKRYLLSYLIIFLVSLIIEVHITSLSYQNNFLSLSDIIPKILSVFALFSIFININQQSCLFKYFLRYGRYTLIIYLVHFPIEESIYNNYITLLPYNIFGFLILLLITWLASVLICYLVNRLKLINFIFYPRKYINILMDKTKLGKYLIN